MPRSEWFVSYQMAKNVLLKDRYYGEKRLEYLEISADVIALIISQGSFLL